MNSAPPSLPPVRIAAAGVTTWLGKNRRSVERDLVEMLLGAPAGEAPHLRILSQRAGCPAAELGRALFQLNRSKCLCVGDDPGCRDADGPAGFAGLDEDLAALLAGPGRAVIADRDGLCLAAWGWPRNEAEHAAALAATRSYPAETGARWWFRSGEVTLAANSAIDAQSPAWVRIARRLLHACGPLCAGAPA